MPPPQRRRRPPPPPAGHDAPDARAAAAPRRAAGATEGTELAVTGFSHGGEGVGRLPDGKACFVPGAIPGERVRVQVVQERARWARADLLAVVEASPDRIEPPCPHYRRGCGGCQLQHIAPNTQAALKERVVREQLERVGGVEEPRVTPAVRPGALDEADETWSFAYRHVARFAVDDDGRLGFRRRASHDLVPIDACPLLTPEASDARDLAGDAWRGAQEVTVRGVPGGRAVVVRPGEGPLPPLPAGDVPVAVLGESGPAAPLRGDATLVVEVRGRPYRVSPESFFQSNLAGAGVLVDLVGSAADVGAGDRVLDLYAGVGLLTAPLAATGARVTAVEGWRPAVADARENLADLATADVVHADVALDVRDRRAAGEVVDVVVLDPPRRGAGEGVVRAIAALRPRTIVYVACDPAALARDVRTFAGEGYALHVAVPVDQFAQTAQVEVVATLHRTG